MQSAVQRKVFSMKSATVIVTMCIMCVLFMGIQWGMYETLSDKVSEYVLPIENSTEQDDGVPVISIEEWEAQVNRSKYAENKYLAYNNSDEVIIKGNVTEFSNGDIYLHNTKFYYPYSDNIFDCTGYEISFHIRIVDFGGFETFIVLDAVW